MLRSVAIGAGFVAAMFAGAVVAHAQEPVAPAAAEVTATVTATPVATAAPQPPPVATPVATARPAATPAPTATATPPPAPPRAVAAQTPAPTPTPTPTPAPDEDPDCAQQGFGGCAVHIADCTEFGTPGDDVLIGSEAAEVLCGLAGNDVIDGGGGDDSIYGGAGDDDISGGPGDDCLIGGDGENDEFPDREDGDVVSQDGLGGTEEAFIGVGKKGHCKALTFGGGIKTPPTKQGGITEAASTGSLLLDIVQSSSEPPAAGSVTVGDRGAVRDGVATLLITCKTAVAGTVVLEVKRGGAKQRVGRGPFKCAPPTDPAEIELTQAGRRRLEQRGTLKVTAKVTVDGREIASEPVVIRAAEG